MRTSDRRAHSSLTRQLPFNVPFSAKTNLIGCFLGGWAAHCAKCFDAIHSATLDAVRALAQKHFGRARALLGDVRVLCDALVEQRRAAARELIAFQLKLEDPPFTINDVYFSACRKKFLTQYRAAQKVGSCTFFVWRAC